MALFDRCGGKIAVANDLDRAEDIDRRRHGVMVAGEAALSRFWHLLLAICLLGLSCDSLSIF